MLLVHQTGNSGSGAPGLRSGLPTRKRADTRDHPSVFKKEDFHIHCARDSREKNLILAYKLDSLVRVSRRADYNHYASILAEARTSPGARCITRGYNTPEGATFLKSYPAAPDDAGLQRGE